MPDNPVLAVVAASIRQKADSLIAKADAIELTAAEEARLLRDQADQLTKAASLIESLPAPLYSALCRLCPYGDPP